MKFFYLIIY